MDYSKFDHLEDSDDEKPDPAKKVEEAPKNRFLLNPLAIQLD